MTGRPRNNIASMPRYRPGKGAAQAEKAHGITNAVKLASNETPWPPIPSVVAAMSEAVSGVNRYADHRCTEVRQRLADWIGVTPDRVTVGSGSSNIIQQLYLAYVDPADQVVYPWRSFEIYPVYAQLVGAESVQVPLDGDTPDLDAVAAAVTERTKLVLVATPNNPTGTVVDADALARLAERIGPDALLVIDEAYREFTDPALGDPIVDLIPRFDNVVVLRTFSKAQGLAGVRVGYAVAHPDVIDTIDVAGAPFAVNAVAQAGAVAVIEAFDEVMERVETVKAERARMTAALRAGGVELADSHANFLWLPIGERTDEIYLELEKRGLVTRPFSGDGLRITVGAPEENDRVLAAVAELDL